jgi:hypothetical protein
VRHDIDGPTDVPESVHQPRSEGILRAREVPRAGRPEARQRERERLSADDGPKGVPDLARLRDAMHVDDGQGNLHDAARAAAR